MWFSRYFAKARFVNNQQRSCPVTWEGGLACGRQAEGRFNARSSSMAVFVVTVVIAVMVVIMTDVHRVGMAIAPARRR